MLADEIIVPEYCPLWQVEVDRVLNKRFPPAERIELHEKVMDAFNEGMCSRQSEESLLWMNDCVTRSGLSRSDIAQKMDVDRAHIGRWLTGENEIPFRRFQRLYVLFGLRSGAGMPLKEDVALHFGGYARAVGLVYTTLTGEVDGSQGSLLDLETLLCIHHFYATFDPFERVITMSAESQRLVEEALVDAREVVSLYVPSTQVRIHSSSDLLSALTRWGAAWLICVRLLAEEEGGITAHYVSAKRGIRLRRLDRGDFGT